MPKLFKSNIWKVYAFNFLASLHFIGGVLIPFFMDWGQISFFQIMILQSWFVIWVFLLEVPTGAVADYLGRKSSMIMATIACIVGVFVYTSRPDFLMFLLGEFLWALGVALSSGASEAFVYDSLKEAGQEKQSKKVFGRFSSFGVAGIMVAAPIGSVIAATLGLRYAFLLMVIPLSLACLIAFTFKEPKTEKKVESLRYFQTLVSGIKYLYSHKVLRILAIDGIVIAVLAVFLVWIYQLLLRQLDVNLAYFGVIHALLAGIQIIAMNNFERLEKIFRSKSRYLFFSAFISGIGFIYLGMNGYVIPAIIAMLIIAGLGLSRFVLITNYMQKHIESYNRATVTSAASMLRRFGLIVTYPMVGLMVEWSLSYALIILVAVIIGFSLIPKIKESYLVD